MPAADIMTASAEDTISIITLNIALAIRTRRNAKKTKALPIKIQRRTEILNEGVYPSLSVANSVSLNFLRIKD